MAASAKKKQNKSLKVKRTPQKERAAANPIATSGDEFFLKKNNLF